MIIHIGLVLPDATQLSHLHQLVYKAVIHEQLVELIRGLALVWQGLQWVRTEIRHRHAKDGRP
jgi:hypothetical protein